VENPIVFGGVSSYECLVGGARYFWCFRPDFDWIEMKFGINIEFNVLNNFPKFGHDQLIRGLAPTLP